ncbi:MAG: NAD-dependent epimerase/dehydratase family protein [Actinobacteria bacterium]|jgi:dihydroflavonol-4-reductase|nr:NAD-dependent epimerase/dehydratase family protein [Actinomycetota bacterium]NDB05304.1 NAD-dependent epimerase/dehydratase family protein [Acidimicrobiia bacterium]NDA76814.1 NAD-dependent epimerase/dehydratase family protein [Actinomycetota bacterium]NDE58980.1 NAD-dependent epimerase/dehydratase family protein [Acidimicrobiia bacterium]NDE79665.1 NAD-dependent epimerase/dehydratase family protein [Actinomycetota bacterium]
MPAAGSAALFEGDTLMTERVLLTGISGYIGQHCGAELLKQGFEVVGTVRSMSKVGATKAAIASAASIEKLRFVEADLLSDAGWDAAMQGCGYVMHVASPFVLAEPKDENDLITPAVDGTRRVINAAKRAHVRRLVLTSSTFAMVSGKPTGRYGADSWSDLDANIGAYAKSKTLAERAAWEAVAGSAMELTVVNPGAVFGPSLGAEIDGQSVALMKDMIGGKMPMIPDVAMGMIDVRDVARLHVAAMTAPAAAGKRFIAASAEPISMAYFASVLRDAGYPKAPSRKAPNFAIRLMSVFDRQAKGMVPSLGKKAAFDNRATFDILGWQPTAMEKSISEMAATLR